MPQPIRIAGLAIVALCLVLACGPQATTPPPAAPTARPTAQPARAATATPTPKPPATPEPRERNTPTPVAQLPSGIGVTDVVQGLNLPGALAFAPDGRLFFTEVKTGAVRVLNADGTLQSQPFYSLKVAQPGEQGALGLALDPSFTANRYVYVYYTHARNDRGEPENNRVVRLTDVDGRGTNLTKIVDDLPHGICCHNGGRIGFGPDGKLYVTVGDQNYPERIQDPKRLHGKVLRVNPNGTIPGDNPIPDSAVFARGFRNPWGLAFHPTTGLPYVTDNGDIGHDEINRVSAGGNYGTPDVEGFANDPRFVDPVWESGVGRFAPTGATFYTGRMMPEYHGDLFFCAFNTTDLSRIRLGGDNLDRVAEQDVVAKGCHLDVVNGPEGALYFASVTGIHRFGR